MMKIDFDCKNTVYMGKKEMAEVTGNPTEMGYLTLL